MEVQSLGSRTDLMVRRLAGSSIDDLGDHLVVRTPSNPAFHWGNFILVGGDVADPGRWVGAFHAAHPEAAHLAIGLEVAGVDDAVRADYAAAGLEVELSEVLTASALRGPRSDVSCRALSADDDWSQLHELGLASHDITAPVEIEFALRRVAESRGIAAAGHGAWFGAFVDGQLVSSLGLVTDGGGIGRYQSVETHPDFRRRGIARALLLYSAGVAGAEYGVQELVIFADPEYHAIELYRSLGFSTVEVQVQVGRAVG